MISPRGRVSTIAGSGTPGYDDGAFSSPVDIAVWRDWAWWPYPNPIDPDSFLYRNGNGALALFVADAGNHRIQKLTGDLVYDPETGERIWSNVQVECFSGRCTRNPEPGYADGKKEDARFDSPRGLAVGSDGHVYVADTNNQIIRRIDQSGVVTTIAGLNSRHNGGNARFNYPSDVALDKDEQSLLVTDRHHIFRVNLSDGLVTKLAGGDNEGDRDGDGVESTLNNPASITVTGDGVAYVADTASCRLRRVSSAELLAPKVSCGASLASILRPQGCSSYNSPIDEYGLAATPAEGNIHYNHQFKDEFDIGLGRDFIGRSMKNCVGSPPISRLDKKQWSETTSLHPFNYNLVVDDNNTFVREDPNDGTRITVYCDENCSNITEISVVLLGSEPSGIGAANVYSEEASVCGAALNEGILDETGRGIVDVTVVSEDWLRRLTKNKATGARQYFIMSKSSQEVRLQTISGAPASLQGQFCGYQDSFPPQAAKVSTGIIEAFLYSSAPPYLLIGTILLSSLSVLPPFWCWSVRQQDSR